METVSRSGTKAAEGSQACIETNVPDVLIPKAVAAPAPAKQIPSTISRDLLERVAAPAGSILPLPRLLLVFAHPDDEVLAMGARLERLAASRLVTITDGVPADGADALGHGFQSLAGYRAARRDELAAAFAHAGVSLADLSPAKPLPTVPVPDQTAALHLSELTLAVAQAMLDLAPEAVLTHPYEGGHPDHDACAFAVHTAVQWLHEAHTNSAPSGAPLPVTPLILETPSYHAGDHGSMCTGVFLDDSNLQDRLVVELSPGESAQKQARLACFGSQAETLAQFDTAREQYRVAPQYDFSQPPHPGQLFYERFSWGMSGERFRTLAAEARVALFASGTHLQVQRPVDLNGTKW